MQHIRRIILAAMMLAALASAGLVSTPAQAAAMSPSTRGVHPPCSFLDTSAVTAVTGVDPLTHASIRSANKTGCDWDGPNGEMEVQILISVGPGGYAQSSAFAQACQ